MKFQQQIILLPCHSLEDFPLHHTGDEAQGLLANWTAMWHPALLAATGEMPQWRRCDDPPDELDSRLILVPSVSVHELQTGFSQRVESEGSLLIKKGTDRGEIVRQALSALEGGEALVDPDFAADMQALGYCYLQIELLTRQMRYSSNLDEVYFSAQAVGAAQAAVAGNMEEARQKLQACFDVLAEERNHYYPVDAFLLDLVLVAETTLGEALREELADPTPKNLLISAGLVETMAADEPETLALLKTALAEGRVGLIGGEIIERRLPLLSPENIRAELLAGRETYERHLGRAATVFGRRRYGLTPSLPQILHKLGFDAALHATLDDGRFPQGAQFKTRWEGTDGTAIDAISRPPQDASLPETYLGFAMKMGESMDMDHVATICVAHWPGRRAAYFDDVRRIARYSTALGKFVTIESYFKESANPGHQDRFAADQYHSPYLKQAVIRRQPDPVSTVADHWRRRTTADAADSLSALAALVTGDAASNGSLSTEIDAAAESADAGGLDDRLQENLAAAARRFAAALPRQKEAEQQGCLILNPCSYVRRVGLELPELPCLPAVEKPVYAAAESGNSRHVVVDLPPLGFAWVAAGKSPPQADKRQPLMGEKIEGACLLRNEFFEAIVSNETGHLQSIHEYKQRGNRLSTQLALRTPGEGRRGDADYSLMAADSVELTIATTALAEVVSKGRLIDPKGKRHAGFEMVYRLWRGSRVLQLDVSLDVDTEPRSDPWNSYYCARFAWADEASDVWGTTNQTRVAAGKRIEAPHYVEIEDAKNRTAILAGGAPFHRRIGLRMLDTILVTRHERRRSFKLGVGIDLTHPMHEAISLLSPPPVISESAPPPSPAASSWLFHIDNKNVIVTHLSPRVEEGRIVGYRLRLLETAGRPSRVAVSSFRAPVKARQLDFLGRPLADCKVEDGKVKLEMSKYEWAEIEVDG